jgi:hypothetical protein
MRQQFVQARNPGDPVNIHVFLMNENAFDVPIV